MVFIIHFPNHLFQFRFWVVRVNPDRSEWDPALDRTPFYLALADPHQDSLDKPVLLTREDMGRGTIPHKGLCWESRFSFSHQHDSEMMLSKMTLLETCFIIQGPCFSITWGWEGNRRRIESYLLRSSGQLSRFFFLQIYHCFWLIARKGLLYRMVNGIECSLLRCILLRSPSADGQSFWHCTTMYLTDVTNP